MLTVRIMMCGLELFEACIFREVIPTVLGITKRQYVSNIVDVL